MILADTHCHLDFPDFDRDRDAVIERAKTAGVLYIINIGCSLEGCRNSLELAEKFPMVYAAIGIHPHSAKDVGGKIPGEIREAAGRDKVVGIGEIGLDYYRNLSPKELQKDLFIEFVRFAIDKALPVIVHTRDAHDDALAILKSESGGKVEGVMHCFSSDEKHLKEYLKLGLHISFTCNLTFKNAGRLKDVASKVPVERLLLETDAPFMAPEGKRGKRNEPANLTYLVDELSRLHGLSGDDIARITTHNAKRLFGLPIKEDSVIAYPIRDSLYINITNRCTNNCDFCVRNSTDFVKGHNLKLDREPSAADIIKAVGDPKRHKEIVFCGYGEPTLRLDLVKETARLLKEKGARVRMVTNGEGSLIHKRPIAKELTGLIDKISISLNVDTSAMYDSVCRSEFGGGVFEKVKGFAKSCRDAAIDVELTFLDLPGVDLERCKAIAKDLGVNFRLRRQNVVG